MIYADIVVDITHEKLDHTFQYAVPEHLADQVRPGCRVRIPFGSGNRLIEGYVISLGDTAKIEPNRIKHIDSIVENGVSVESRLIKLAAWIRSEYGSTMIQALKTVVPVKNKKKPKQTAYWRIRPNAGDPAELLKEFARRNQKARARVLEALCRTGTAEETFLKKEANVSGAVLKTLAGQGILERTEPAGERASERTEPAGGNIPERTEPAGEEASHGAESGCSGAAGSFPRETGSPQPDGAGQPDGTGQPESNGQPESPGQHLTENQRAVIEGILSEWKSDDRPCLIRGVTGSGKTHVYIELLRHVISGGKQAIVLIPEISLTWQTVRRFTAVFGSRVTVLHSRMTTGDRQDHYERIRKGECSVVIGPRSALFAPFPALGLIIIDEEHENSYRSEITPRYHARETAVQRSRLEGAHLVMGSATPSVDSCYRCEKGEYALFTLEQRFGDAALPGAEIVDMRQELRNGNRSILSMTLQEKLLERLERGEQTMLFLNRRGYAGFVSCRSCGYVARCPHCDVAMTLHRNGKMVCHYCGYSVPAIKACPSCGSPYVGGFQAGTQQVEAVVKKIFPEARILRMDADTTKGREDHQKILSAFASGEADVLIGTQMIVKGHDFPKVTLVGIISADLSLFSSDFRACERTYQLLVQAIGRAGRGKLPGEAVIQTYHPDHYAIRCAVEQDYPAFYREELAGRQIMNYPPSGELLVVHGACGDEERLAEAMSYIQRYLLRIKKASAELLGPAPESVSRIQDLYRMAVYVKSSDRQELNTLRRSLEKYIEINSGFHDIFIQYEYNA